MTKRVWAVVNYIHEKGEWLGKVRFSSVHKAVAEKEAWEIRKKEGWGPSELVVRKLSITTPDVPVTSLLLNANTVQEVRDILVEAHLTYHEVGSGTKKKWERAARARELALNRAEAGRQIVALDQTQLLINAPGLLGPDGRPVREV